MKARGLVRACAAIRASALLLALASGCAGSGLRPGRHDPLRFARADVLAARRGAPDLFARAQRARADALATDDPEARAEHGERARAWLAAALAETRRIAHMRAASAAEARVVAAETRRAELERARVELEREAERAAVAAGGREQLAHALQRAESDALGDAARSRGLDEERAQAAELLRARARLVRAAAIALQLPSQRAAVAAPASSGRADGATAHQRLAAARAELERAESALGEARALSREPSAQERAALFELARERGLEARESSRGVVFPLPDGLRGARLDRAARVWLLRIAAVLRAHPHGPVQLQVAPAANASAAERHSGTTAGARIAAMLAKVTRRDRAIAIEPSDGSDAALVLPAYATAAPVAAVPPGPQACLSAAHAPAR
ncbi:MAG TPA: hypothetical protein VK509_05740 [Polyangiales bacterium]|nr:hypothetical protein [Polyangiales bacterium]